MSAPVHSRGRVLRGGALLMGGNVAASALMLGRNLALAALLPIEDYGIAASLVLTVAAAEALSSFGLPVQMVQARDGDRPGLQATIQGMQLLRGVATALLLLVVAGPISRAFGAPEAGWGFAALALVPLIGAFTHFDIHRLGRAMRFGPQVAHLVLPPALALAAAWPLATWLGDWRAMAAMLAIHAAAACAASHLVAERRWRIDLAPAGLARVLRFGWPLLIGSILSVAVLHGDRLVVATWFDMATLGVFAMGITLTLTPALVLQRAVGTLALPLLSPSGETGEDPQRGPRAVLLLRVVLILMALYVAVLPPLLGLGIEPVFGPDFAALVPLLPLMTASAAALVWRCGPGTIAMSHGRTRLVLWTSAPRVAGLAVAAAALGRGAPLETLLWCAFAGEAVSGALLLAILAKGLRLPLRPLAAPALLATATTAASLLHAPVAALALAAATSLWLPGLHAMIARRVGPQTMGSPA